MNEQQRKAMELALEALEDRGELSANEFKEKKNGAITAIKKALAQTEQEPVAFTDEKISLIAHNIDSGDWNDLNFKECWHNGFKAGFREAEIEHNIKCEV